MPAYDQIVVVDLEATCWEGEPPPGAVNEIIEVGVCLLSIADLAPSRKRSLLVRPERSTVSPFCTQLTTLTQSLVDGGGTLAEALDVLVQEYDSPNRVWASYGRYDLRMVAASCEAQGLKYPFGPSHVNVRMLAPLVLGGTNPPSFRAALTAFELEFEGTQHRGDDDAWNVARLLAEMLRRTRG
jgi:inhibitor of KinA sporulation pathway (predicted exonuclease)